MGIRNLKSYIKQRVIVTETGCWEWQASRVKDGYGHCRIEGRFWLVHRLAYILWRGKIRRGWFVRHKCNNPPCCNPRHLLEGTHEDNTLDIVGKKKVCRILTEKEKRLAMTMRIQGKTIRSIAENLHCSFYLAKSTVSTLSSIPTGRPKGSKNFLVRITDEIKNKILSEYSHGKTQAELAQKYRCHQTYVSLIIRRFQ